MRLTIIALILAIAALGLSGFATFTSLNSEDAIEATPAAVSGWSGAECLRAEAQVNPGGELWKACRSFDGDCAPYNDMLQAINDNCE